MPRIKKPRNKGVTYKLVPRSYGDADGEYQGPLWVSEAELFRRHQSAVPAEDEDAARRQFNMYAVAANAEFNDERRGRRAEEGEDDACGVYDDGEADAEEQSHEEEYYDGHGEEDGEWVDGDWRDEEKPEAPHLRVAMQKAALPPTSAADPALASSCPPAAAACPRDEDGHESEVASEADEEQEEEKLFDDEVEGEVTDDFLRQLYPTHDTTQRALDRQFTEMMREFDADARLNDAYTDDPRTHGALPMDKYLTALEEFVASRAGIDVETAEPHKNKGLIQQLKYLSYHAGAFDSDARGVYMTTILPEKQQRFVEEFQKGTEEIRHCETAISAYSTYYNQPNVIQAPRRSAQARRVKKAPVSRRGGELIDTEAESNNSHRNGDTDTSATTLPTCDSDSEGTAPVDRGHRAVDVVLTVRRKDETKEEKMMRRQAVKAAQRERRQAKSALKHTYKEVESEELRRSATSQAARRTVHFM
ncbi:hypothetical protein CGC21_28265 [Leishmania donovani]|uniref:Uncharacterized protein n=1 Tax=Leishmania donovani TaxID=5661 RepID=A0A504Y0C2_LEIDO|nr:hypothetical protein CGC21_28265 [Leishmania donovani]